MRSARVRVRARACACAVRGAACGAVRVVIPQIKPAAKISQLSEFSQHANN
jgi:hypothetical protein